MAPTQHPCPPTYATTVSSCLQGGTTQWPMMSRVEQMKWAQTMTDIIWAPGKFEHSFPFQLTNFPTFFVRFLLTGSDKAWTNTPHLHPTLPLWASAFQVVTDLNDTQPPLPYTCRGHSWQCHVTNGANVTTMTSNNKDDYNGSMTRTMVMATRAVARQWQWWWGMLMTDGQHQHPFPLQVWEG